MAERVQQYPSKNHEPPTEHAPPTEHTDGTTCSLDTPQLWVRFENVNSEPFAMDALHPEMHPHDLVASIPSWNIQPFHDSPGHAIYSATLFPRLRQEGQRPIKVCIKWARCEADVDKLKAEAEVYRTALCHLQRTVVPIYYGCFIGKRPGFAATYGCLILEWCATDSIPDYGCKTRGKVKAALRNLHGAGVILHEDCTTEKNFLLAPDNTVRVVGFSCDAHKCHLDAANECQDLNALLRWL